MNLPKVKSLIQTYLIFSVLLENRLAFLDAKVEVLEKEMVLAMKKEKSQNQHFCKFFFPCLEVL